MLATPFAGTRRETDRDTFLLPLLIARTDRAGWRLNRVEEHGTATVGVGLDCRRRRRGFGAGRTHHLWFGHDTERWPRHSRCSGIDRRYKREHNDGRDRQVHAPRAALSDPR